jgi:hypothetical protein
MANFEKRESNPRGFRISLHVDFDGIKIENREHLKQLMTHKSYHLTGKGLETRSPPTNKQLDFAWEELQKSYEPAKEQYRYVWVKAYQYVRGTNIVYVKRHRRKIHV